MILVIINKQTCVILKRTISRCVRCLCVREREITKPSLSFKVITTAPASTIFIKKLSTNKSRDKLRRYFSYEILAAGVEEKPDMERESGQGIV